MARAPTRTMASRCSLNASKCVEQHRAWTTQKGSITCAADWPSIPEWLRLQRVRDQDSSEDPPQLDLAQRTSSIAPSMYARRQLGRKDQAASRSLPCRPG